MALAAVEAGKPFWIEKPMGVSAEQSRQIAQAAEKAGLMTAVGFNYRHTPAIEYLRSLVRGGELGRITNVRVWFIADYNSSPMGPLTWRASKEKAGAGVVPDLMSHGADLAQYIVGRISSVTAVTDTFITERPIPTKMGIGHSGFEIGDEVGPVENEDYVSMLVRFENGTVGTMESSRVSVGPRAEYVVEVYGTKGSAPVELRAPQRAGDLPRARRRRLPRLHPRHGRTPVGVSGSASSPPSAPPWALTT